MKLHLRVFVFLLTAMAAAVPARAWEKNGHRLVCDMAFQLLDKGTQSRVTDLIGKYQHPDGDRYESFSEACVFPDLAGSKAREYEAAVAEGKKDRAVELARWKRFSRYDGWHFLNVPRSARDVEASYCGDGCILTGIAESSQKLADKSAGTMERAEALIFLGHWMADLHQPLHVSYADDDHGDAIPTVGYYGPYSLYKVWNEKMVDKRNRDSETAGGYAKVLLEKLKTMDHADWTTGDPLAWANESYHIVTQPGFRYCEWSEGSCMPLSAQLELTDDYRDEFEGVLDGQLMRAAVRLAASLEKALGD